MNAPPKAQTLLQAYRVLFYRRALHPELFKVCNRISITHREYEFEGWSSPGSPSSASSTTAPAVELLTNLEGGLPDRGVIAGFPPWANATTSRPSTPASGRSSPSRPKPSPTTSSTPPTANSSISPATTTPRRTSGPPKRADGAPSILDVQQHRKRSTSSLPPPLHRRHRDPLPVHLRARLSEPSPRKSPPAAAPLSEWAAVASDIPPRASLRSPSDPSPSRRSVNDRPRQSTQRRERPYRDSLNLPKTLRHEGQPRPERAGLDEAAGRPSTSTHALRDARGARVRVPRRPPTPTATSTSATS